MSDPSRTPAASLAARAAPAVFVVLWSTGFIGTKFALEGAEPLTMQTLRMSVVVTALGLLALATRPRWPDVRGAWHSVVAAILVHGFYLGGTAVAIHLAVPAGLSALIPGLQPVLTSTLANAFLGERVGRLQWIGLACGLVGVGMVLSTRSFDGASPWGWLASAVALVSITLGTLYQKRFCGEIDWRAGNFIQFVAVALFFGLGAWMFETREIVWSASFVASVLWLALMLSVGSIGLLYWLIRRAGATQVASLFYLVPGVTALMAWALFDERLGLVAILGMALCAGAVLLVNRAR